ncbi:hypothetical protein [Roseobacter sp. HKCCA0434]|uniref:hypothetical protein n=1 Tax=Roseobacter sp. HKCCA0434 TaxID=3079297 RepID=UPI002905F1F1|nr:hypothetical protein [Roseobacter sp. HKCCA0434]
MATAEHLVADVAGAPFEAGLDRVLARPGPVTLMLHGFRYCPFHVPSPDDPELRDPHRLIYADRSEARCDRGASWPALLNRAGPVIGIGWPAMYDGTGGMAALRGFGAVYARAGEVGRQVARLADRIAAVDPGRRIDVVAHSLGARVALAALPHMRLAEPRRILLWGAAERLRPALKALDAASDRTLVVNMRARANRRFDLAFDWRAPGRSAPLGGGLAHRRSVDLLLDDPVVEERLVALGLPLGPRPAGACHWSFYTRDGIGALHADLLDRPGIWRQDRIAALAATPGWRWPALSLPGRRPLGA